MKHVFIVATSLMNYQILKSLIYYFKQDPEIYATIVSLDESRTPEMTVRYLTVEEEGFKTETSTHVVLHGSGSEWHVNSSSFAQEQLVPLFRQYQPDVVLVFGNSSSDLQIAIAASLNRIPIAHIQGGESGFGRWDKSYGYGITKLARLHFTSAELFRQQIVRFGEDELSVFNVGSLLAEKAGRLPCRSRSSFCRKIDIPADNPYIFIDMMPDPNLGSKNEKLALSIMESLPQTRMNVLIQSSGLSGNGKILWRTMENFADRLQDRFHPVALTDIAGFCDTINHCELVISNKPETLLLAAGKKKTALHVTSNPESGIKPCNQINCAANTVDIQTAIQQGLSLPFKEKLTTMVSPFEQAQTAFRIKEVIKGFKPQWILPKSYYISPEAAS